MSNRIRELVAGRFNVPPAAVRMFSAAGAVSGIDRQTLPRELVPLNSIQLSRGLLNYAVFQGMPSWIFPYWVRRQYDPSDSSFIPRSHIGLSINVTQRNWTGAGNPFCTIEPVVDPRGLTTPRPDGWSVDVWLATEEGTLFPSQSDVVEQRLLDEVPVVETTFGLGNVRVNVTSWTAGGLLVQRVAVHNRSSVARNCRIGIAIRPFNPEGVALVHTIVYDPPSRAFRVDGRLSLRLSDEPAAVACANREEGDTAHLFRRGAVPESPRATRCAVGLANAVAEYRFDLGPEALRELHSFVKLSGGEDDPGHPTSPAPVIRIWRELLAQGAEMRTPDPAVNAALRSSLSTVLMLSDGDSITPGPCTYHQFWFRDAAFMIRALDVWGHSVITRPMLEAFPQRQQQSGYYRSQQGEWDSTGQAIWTVVQHVLITGDTGLASRLFESMRSGIRWIGKHRVGDRAPVGKLRAGLHPPGLSAEHLGLADQYFWDNFWSIAGIEAFLRVCSILRQDTEMVTTTRLLKEYQGSVTDALADCRKREGTNALPAAPGRSPDSGMIGSCCAWYPLQIYPPDDVRLEATLKALQDLSFHQGMFFQHFIHSGMNTYLTLQVAHAWLYQGDRRRFWELLRTVLDRRSSTGTLPEAIHPATGGGCMGDGHHGWAAAEILLALRDAVVFEQWTDLQSPHDVILLAGIPAGWCTAGCDLRLDRAPIVGGTMTLLMQVNGSRLKLFIHCDPNGSPLPGAWIVKLPAVGAVASSTIPLGSVDVHDTETTIRLASIPTHAVLEIDLIGGRAAERGSSL